MTTKGGGENSPHAQNGSVLFADDEEVPSEARSGGMPLSPEDIDLKDSRRFLTAKYQKQQLGMIRRRIAVEDWIEEELSGLFKKDGDANGNEDDEDHDVCIDLDEVLGIQGDEERVKYVKDKLSQSAQASDMQSADIFIGNLITKLHEL